MQKTSISLLLTAILLVPALAGAQDGGNAAAPAQDSGNAASPAPAGSSNSDAQGALKAAKDKLKQDRETLRRTVKPPRPRARTRARIAPRPRPR